MSSQAETCEACKGPLGNDARTFLDKRPDGYDFYRAVCCDECERLAKLILLHDPYDFRGQLDPYRQEK